MLSLVDKKTFHRRVKHSLSNGADTEEMMMVSSKLIPDIFAFTGKIGIICGNTNIAGYGYALAMSLFDNKCDVKILLLERKFTSVSKKYFDECIDRNIPYEIISDKTDFSSFYVLVDALLNIDFTSNKVSNIIDRINASNRFVISLNLNSGLDMNTGLGKAVRSDLTIAFNNYSLGHFLGSAKDYIGRNVLINLGLKRNTRFKLIEMDDFRGIFKKRKNNSSKYDYGVSTILGGSIEYSGAIKLSNMALSSLLSGSGLSRLVVPKSLSQAVLPYMLESTLDVIDDIDGHMVFDKDSIDRSLKNAKSLVIGPGWGKSDDYKKIISYILGSYSLNVIIDADGLNVLSDMDLNILSNSKCNIVLTPHLKEFSRLCKKDIEEITHNIDIAIDFAKAYNIILLLKGPTTIITDGDLVYLVDKGSAGMATAGSGDVLSGILGGLMSYLDYNLLNVSLGAYINGLAGEEAEKSTNDISMLSSDTIRFIGKAISKIKG